MPGHHELVFRVLRGIEAISPTLAARCALGVLGRPPALPTRPWTPGIIPPSVTWFRTLHGRRCARYEWPGDGPLVVLVHGWGTRATAMDAFVEPLLGRGFRVVTLDLPAHGRSRGWVTDFMEVAHAVHEVAGSQPYGVVAHSGGAFATAIAHGHLHMNAERLVLLAPVAGAMWMSQTFAGMSRLTPSVLERMRELLTSRYEHRWTWSELAVLDLLAGAPCPVLLGHGQRDRVIPVQQSIEMAERLPHVALHLLEGVGHAGVVQSEAMVERVVAFLAPA